MLLLLLLVIDWVGFLQVDQGLLDQRRHLTGGARVDRGRLRRREFVDFIIFPRFVMLALYLPLRGRLIVDV